jgi:NADPH-dependent glutamate synthase beta subunit-like oxidoreductase
MFFLVIFAFILWLVAELQRINYGIIGTSLGLFILYCFNLFDAYKGPSRSSAPCEKKCPAGLNIPHYIALTRAGRYNDALMSIMDRMPFPAACGRICHHPCESLCALRTKEGPIAIELLKRAAADFGTLSLQSPQKQQKSKSIGIIVGKEMEFDDVRKKHDAVLIAAGVSASTPLEVPGADLEGVTFALELLSTIRRGKKDHLKGKTVAVIGGGNTAFDAARTAIRSGAKAVTIYYRRNPEEMPGNLEELTMAQREGVNIEYQVTPVRFKGDKRISGIELKRTELRKVAGKPRSEIIPIEGSNFTISCDYVLIATGQEPNFNFLPEVVQNKIKDIKSIHVHPLTLATQIPGIFAAGDITQRQKRTVVDAVETGRKAAQGIDWYLRGVTGFGRMVERLTRFDYPLPRTIDQKSRTKGKRNEQQLLDRQKATGSHAEVELGLSEEEAKKEASRCLQCNKLL